MWPTLIRIVRAFRFSMYLKKERMRRMDLPIGMRKPEKPISENMPKKIWAAA